MGSRRESDESPIRRPPSVTTPRCVSLATMLRNVEARVQRGEADGIAVAYDDRLTRDWRKLGRHCDELEAAGAEVVIVNHPSSSRRRRLSSRSTR
jgi:hypothetical protein